MIDIYLSRHGKTLWNQQLRMQGTKNSPLTDEGVAGAKALADDISSLTQGIKKVLVSPMPRAIHTAYLATRNLGIPMEIEPLLAEMDLGIWEGVSIDDAKRDYPYQYDCFRHHPDLFVPPDKGETYFEVVERARKLFEKLSTLSENDGPILLVSHMILVQAVLCICENRDVSTLRQTEFIEQAKLYKIRIHDEPRRYEVLMRGGKSTD